MTADPNATLTNMARQLLRSQSGAVVDKAAGNPSSGVATEVVGLLGSVLMSSTSFLHELITAAVKKRNIISLSAIFIVLLFNQVRMSHSG